MCLTRDQATQIYEEVEKNEPINIQVTCQGIENERKVRKGQVKRKTWTQLKIPIKRPL